MRCLSRKAKKDPTCRSVDSFEQCCTNSRPFVRSIPETYSYLFHFSPNQKPASPRLPVCGSSSSSLHHDLSAKWPRNHLGYLFQKQLRGSACWLTDGPHPEAAVRSSLPGSWISVYRWSGRPGYWHVTMSLLKAPDQTAGARP